MQMLHEWIGERLKQLSSFLAIIFLGPSKNLVHILLQYVHSSMEKLMLFHVVSSLVEKRKEKRFFAMVVAMDRGQATQRLSSECVLVFGFHKGCVSPDRVDGTDEDVVDKSHVIRQVRRQIVGDDGEEWSIRKGNERV